MAGLMQGILLITCITFKIRQSRLGIDDFGHPYHTGIREDIEPGDSDESSPIEVAVGQAIHEDPHTSERTPLVSRQRSEGSQRKKGWRNFFSSARRSD
jgi:hypothetical protein